MLVVNYLVGLLLMLIDVGAHFHHLKTSLEADLSSSFLVGEDAGRANSASLNQPLGRQFSFDLGKNNPKSRNPVEKEFWKTTELPDNIDNENGL
jgi:hypothetical protein